MSSFDLRRLHAPRRLSAVALAMACTGGLAAAASAATLHVRVTPAAIHKKTNFQIVITGTYNRSELKGNAYLVSFIQYNLKPCKPGAGQELHAFGQNPFTHQNTGSSPFGWQFTFTAGGAGARRVCAYLYPKQVGPSSTIAPLKRATATYQVKP